MDACATAVHKTPRRSSVTPEVFIKYRQSTTETEGQTLLYLEQCLPNVPAPRLYAMYHDGPDFFIVMQRIPGRSLDTMWNTLSESDKDDLTARLREIFADMRKVPSPQPGFLGAVDGGPIPHHLFYSKPFDQAISGPFSSEQAFNAGIVQNFKKIVESNQHPRGKLDWYTAYLGHVLCGHQSVFTHSDLQQKNIMVIDRTSQESDVERSYDVYIVDWEDGGWYPEYWEYAVSFCWFSWGEDWSTRFAEFLPAWPAESAVLKLVYTDLYF